MDYIREELSSTLSTLPQLQESVPTIYQRIERYYNNFSYQVNQVGYPIKRLSSELDEIANEIDSCITKIKNIAYSTKTTTFTSSAYANQNSKNSGITIDVGKCERIADSAYRITNWSERIENEINMALSIEQSIYNDVDSWVQTVCTTYEPIVKDYHSQIKEISDNISPDMSIEECDIAEIKCNMLLDMLKETQKELTEKMHGTIVYNPWSSLLRDAEEYYGIVRSCSSEDMELVVLQLEICKALLASDFPEKAMYAALRNGSILEIPSKLDFDGTEVSINKIEGTILPFQNDKSTTRVDNGLCVIIPESVNELQGNCFYNRSVKSVTMKNPTPPLQHGVMYYKDFDEIDIDYGNCPFMLKEETDAILYVPEEAVNTYKESTWAYYFKEIRPISDSAVDSITLDTEDQERMEIYTLNGIKVGNSFDGLEKGAYIVRKGNKASKIMITK